MLTPLEFKQIKKSISALKSGFENDREYEAVRACNGIQNIVETFAEEEIPENIFEVSEVNWVEGLQYLCINENNKIRFELWQWKEMLEHSYMFTKLKENDINEAEIYKNIQKHAELLKTGKSFNEIMSRESLVK